MPIPRNKSFSNVKAGKTIRRMKKLGMKQSQVHHYTHTKLDSYTSGGDKHNRASLASAIKKARKASRRK